MEFLRLFLEYLNKAENLELNINTNMNVITSFYKFLEHCKQFYNGEVEVLHTDYWNKKECKTLTLNFAKKICQDFGSLIEHPKIYSENETIDKILQEILKETGQCADSQTWGVPLFDHIGKWRQNFLFTKRIPANFTAHGLLL